MYKKMNRVIEKEKGESLLSKGIRLFLATDKRRYVNLTCICYTRFFVQRTGQIN